MSAGSGTGNWHYAGDLKVRRGCKGKSQKICIHSAFRFSPWVFSEMRITSKRGRSKLYLARARNLKSPTETEHCTELIDVHRDFALETEASKLNIII